MKFVALSGLIGFHLSKKVAYVLESSTVKKKETIDLFFAGALSIKKSYFSSCTIYNSISYSFPSI